MIEYSILKLFITDRNLYNKYGNYLNLQYIKDNYKDIYKLLLIINTYYNKYNTENISINELEAHYINNYPIIKEGDRKVLSLLLTNIDNASISEPVLDYLRIHKNRTIAGEIALTAFDVSEGKKSLEDLDNIYAKLELAQKQTENYYVSNDLEELYNNTSHIQGLRWRLPWLNQSLGSLRKGDFGFIFARPETGKTTFLASEMSYMAEQADRPILWCNNEEGGGKVMLRCYQAALNLTHSELVNNRTTNKQHYQELIGNRIQIYDDAGMSMHSIEIGRAHV